MLYYLYYTTIMKEALILYILVLVYIPILVTCEQNMWTFIEDAVCEMPPPSPPPQADGVGREPSHLLGRVWVAWWERGDISLVQSCFRALQKLDVFVCFSCICLYLCVYVSE